ncbi:type IV pilus assembly protein PilA [Anoxybacillus calidus]|jgi:type IV pilus assembly protein PilA|uniref:Type IV pilus assembly protein PilA n=1 Tax=[Anoxybacillus] calidus TaxID=575178 RepID=A0A7V9Z0C8_9BACL|nr:prepilin-type N-terminal cleavage/methylation domain-containing protein [Anoxybacillus calidus]MBA2871620.1 type IV pilus assembly protein PilA [Anoxybacillus calidus]
MLKRFVKNERGLTLIELLAVIVILGIIAAIAIPSISNIIDGTRDKAKVAEAIQIINAAKLAHAEHPDQVKWKYNADTTNGYAALRAYLDKVKDNNFEVLYDSSTKTYSIKAHEAYGAVNNILNPTTRYTNDSLIPEQTLIDATK